MAPLNRIQDNIHYDKNIQNNFLLAAASAVAVLAFVTATTTPGSSASAGATAASTIGRGSSGGGGGSGGGPALKTIYPTITSEKKAENDVRRWEENTVNNPYEVSFRRFIHLFFCLIVLPELKRFFFFPLAF